MDNLVELPNFARVRPCNEEPHDRDLGCCAEAAGIDPSLDRRFWLNDDYGR